MRRRMIRVGVGLAFAAVLAPGLAGAVAPVEGLVISPAVSNLVVKAQPGDVAHTLTLRNNTANTQKFTLALADFGALDEQGGVAFLGRPASELAHKFGLASWMTLDRSEISIPAGGSALVTVKIQNRQSLAPGGHYGAVLATAVTETGAATGDPKVGVKQVLSSLMLVTKEGGAKRVLKILEQRTNAGFWHLPRQVEHRFKNEGNLHLVPRGVTELKSPAGQVVARAALNEESGTILPDSMRRYKAPFTTVGRAWMPGRYAVVTQYRYDGTEETKKYTTFVWFTGDLVVVGVIVVALAALGLLGWWLWWRPMRRQKLNNKS